MVSSKASAASKESSLSSWCVASLHITIGNGQPWSVEFQTCRNVLTHKRKVQKYKANISLSLSRHFQETKVEPQ